MDLLVLAYFQVENNHRPPNSHAQGTNAGDPALLNIRRFEPRVREPRPGGDLPQLP